MLKKYQNNFLFSLLSTFFSHFLIALLQIVLLQILARWISEDDMGIYLVIRRLATLSLSIVTLNLGDSMARYISLNHSKTTNYLVYAFQLLFVVFTILSIIVFQFQASLSSWLFGSTEFTLLLFPTLLFLMASAVQALCANYFRGRQKFNHMNMTNIVFWGLALIFVPIFLIPDHPFSQLLVNYLSSFSLISIAFNFYLIWRCDEFRKNSSHLGLRIFKRQVVEPGFVNYGLSRIPNNFFFGAVFFIPVFLATNYASLKVAAYIGIIISLIRMLQLVGLPFNILFVPKLAELISKNKEKEIRVFAQVMLNFILAVPMWIGLSVALFSREIVNIWFGSKYQIVVAQLEIISPIIGLLIGFVIIRGILDGISDFPHINLITFAGFIATLTVGMLYSTNEISLQQLAWSFASGIIVLGMVSMFIYVKLLKIKFWNSENIIVTIWFVIGLCIVHVVIDYTSSYSLITAMIFKSLAFGLLAVITFLIFRGLNLDWLQEIHQRIDSLRK